MSHPIPDEARKAAWDEFWYQSMAVEPAEEAVDAALAAAVPLCIAAELAELRLEATEHIEYSEADPYERRMYMTEGDWIRASAIDDRIAELEAAALRSSVAAQTEETPDWADELPGMWEQADLTGGQTDNKGAH